MKAYSDIQRGADDLGAFDDSLAVNAQVGTTYTVQASDKGKLITLTNASAITVTVPASLAAGFNCSFMQGGAGQVTFAAGSGATQRQAGGYTKLRAQYAMASLAVFANSGGSAADYVLSGEMTS